MFENPQGTKTMTDDEALDFVNSVLRDELVETKEARAATHKTIRTVLYSLGYDSDWIETRFRDILDAKFDLFTEWYPEWIQNKDKDGWLTISPDKDVACVIWREDTHDYYWEVLDSEGYSLNEGTEKTLDEAKSRSLESLDLSLLRYTYEIKIMKDTLTNIAEKLPIMEARLAEELAK